MTKQEERIIEVILQETMQKLENVKTVHGKCTKLKRV